MFSKACEYAIKSSIYIAQSSIAGKRVNVKEVSKAVDAPEAFTAKILQQLCREGIMESIRGKQGGFIFSEEKLSEIKIYDIVKVIDGDAILYQCGLGLKECSDTNPCPVHDTYKIIKENLMVMVKKYSLKDLAERSEQGLFRLKV
ncbi:MULTISPECIES: RrF2 family transcriptional regulator [Amniculibacterium]|jgi:Rrf2 family protein|uniref:RrF2 family transcriptional regulator n=1 Tax=Amniculibacterium TaxID=2715289 RepID=UPI000F5982E8|nr:MULTISPECIES: Rrf2 family transcriptional regulator [Amniculibacterium]